MRYFVIAAAACLVGAPVAAGDVTKVTSLFKSQSIAKQPSRSIGGNEGVLGKGRGLALFPELQDDVPESADEMTETTFVDYTHLEEELRIEVNIQFDFDSAALLDTEKPKLATICEAMKDLDDGTTFQIVGHTDETGPDGYNARLSLLRAAEVRRSMIRDCGIAGERLQAIGVGEEYPANPDNPAADENRRVEFQAS